MKWPKPEEKINFGGRCFVAQASDTPLKKILGTPLSGSLLGQSSFEILFSQEETDNENQFITHIIK